MLKIDDNVPSQTWLGEEPKQAKTFQPVFEKTKNKCLCSLKDLFVVLYQRPGVSQHCSTNCVRISCGYNGCSCLALYEQNKPLMLLIRVKTTQPQTIFEGWGALEIDFLSVFTSQEWLMLKFQKWWRAKSFCTSRLHHFLFQASIWVSEYLRPPKLQYLHLIPIQVHWGPRQAAWMKTSGFPLTFLRRNRGVQKKKKKTTKQKEVFISLAVGHRHERVAATSNGWRRLLPSSCGRWLHSNGSS